MFLFLFQYENVHAVGRYDAVVLGVAKVEVTLADVWFVGKCICHSAAVLASRASDEARTRVADYEAEVLLVYIILPVVWVVVVHLAPLTAYRHLADHSIGGKSKEEIPIVVMHHRALRYLDHRPSVPIYERHFEIAKAHIEVLDADLHLRFRSLL